MSRAHLRYHCSSSLRAMAGKQASSSAASLMSPNTESAAVAEVHWSLAAGAVFSVPNGAGLDEDEEDEQEEEVAREEAAWGAVCSTAPVGGTGTGSGRNETGWLFFFLEVVGGVRAFGRSCLGALLSLSFFSSLSMSLSVPSINSLCGLLSRLSGWISRESDPHSLSLPTPSPLVAATSSPLLLSAFALLLTLLLILLLLLVLVWMPLVALWQEDDEDAEEEDEDAEDEDAEEEVLPLRLGLVIEEEGRADREDDGTAGRRGDGTEGSTAACTDEDEKDDEGNRGRDEEDAAWDDEGEDEEVTEEGRSARLYI